MKPSACVCLLWLLASGSMAQSVRQSGPLAAVDRQAGGEIPLRGKLFFLTDSTAQLTVRQVVDCQRAGQFRPSASLTNRQDFGYNTTAVHWLFFELDGSATAQTRLMLEIEYANLDELELWQVIEGRFERLGLTGDRFQFSPRPYQNNNYVFPIRLQSGARGTGQTTQFYLRLRQPHAILSFFTRLWYRPVFVASDRTEYFLWGIFIGIICIVLVLNMVMLVALRDRIYLWYSLYLHFITMHLFSDSGLGFQYLWPTFPRLNEFSPVYLYVWAAMVAQTTFMQYFIHQTSRNSRVIRWVNGFKIFVTACLVLSIAVPLLRVPGREQYMYQVVSLGTSFSVPVIVVLTIISLSEANRQTGRAGREKVVRYYGYALAVQLTGYVLVAAMNFCQARGWPLPFDVETYVILGLTVLADLVFFTYGLAYRYTHAWQRNQQLELNLLQSRQDAQQQLIGSLQDEHKRLAQDLHDDIGPLLATAKGYLSRLARTDRTPPLQRAQTLLDEAADELRTLSHQLMPRQSEQGSLVNAIAEASRQLTRRGVPVGFVSAGVVRPLGGQQEQLLFSIATQLIRTAQHHPQATAVTVQLLYHAEQVNLSVEDDGQPTRLSATDGANLRAKTDLLRAGLLLDATDAGNSVMVSLLDTVPAAV